MGEHFQINGCNYSGEAQNPTTPEEHYRSIYFEALDVTTASIKSKFDQASFKTYLKLETFLIQAANVDSIDKEIIDFLKGTYSGDLDLDALQVEF